jgi:hypothetical protein
MLKQLQKEYQQPNEMYQTYVFILIKLNSVYFYFFHNSQDVGKSLTVGSIYCTFNQRLFEWHRCEILSIDNSDIAIKYIDIGYIDLVSNKNIKILKVKLYISVL